MSFFPRFMTQRNCPRPHSVFIATNWAFDARYPPNRAQFSYRAAESKEFERAIGSLDAETNRVLWLSGDEEMVDIAIQLFQLGKLGCNFLLTARYRATHFQTRLQSRLEDKYGDMVRDFHGEDKMDFHTDILKTEDTMWFEATDKHNQGCRIAGEDRRTEEYIAALETLLDISNKLASMRNALSEELRLMWGYSTYVESTLSGLACKSRRNRRVVVGPSNIGSARQ
ncbi:hypothetical protein BDZ91DRAFT_713697 [Kalaharituber pfeilii]|nr:hypothetical protein BDZ91DRAFT_713697 [Kalaharituber pfeilii]